jgi:hypothetical protein
VTNCVLEFLGVQGERRSLYPPFVAESLNDVKPLSASDNACLEEVRAVPERQGYLGRFGVMLLRVQPC